jgi:hypothetical protein
VRPAQLPGYRPSHPDTAMPRRPRVEVRAPARRRARSRQRGVYIGPLWPWQAFRRWSSPNIGPNFQSSNGKCT